MNLGALGAVYPGYLAAQKQQVDNQYMQALSAKQQMDVLSGQQTQKAQGVAGGVLGSIGSLPGGLQPQMAAPQQQAPQSPAPGQPSTPMLPPMQQQSQSMPPLARPQGAPGQALPSGPSAAAPSPTGGGGPSGPNFAPAPGSSAGGPSPLGGYDVPSLAALIKQKNPDIDNNTLFQAVAQAQTLLNPDGKMQLAQMGMEMKGQMLEQRAREMDERLRQGEDRLSIQQQALGMRQELAMMSQNGMNTRQKERIEAGLDKLDKQTAAKAPVAARGVIEGKLKEIQSKQAGVKEQMNALRDQYGAYPGPTSPDYQKFKTLQAAQTSLRAQNDRLAHQVTLERLKNPALASAKPDDTAPAAEHKIGDIVDGPDGKKYKIVGGDMSDPDVEPVQ